MSDLFEEINSELKQERALELVKKYFPLVLFLAFIIVMLSLFFVYMNNIKQQKYEKLGQAYYKMLKIGGKDEKLLTESLNNIIKENNGGYSALAAFKKASLLIEKAKYHEALLLYDKISEGDYKTLSSLAQLMAVNLILSHQIKDNDILNRINKISDINHPFYESGLILKAIYLKQYGKKEDLSSLVNNLNDNIGEDIREKLNILVGDYD